MKTTAVLLSAGLWVAFTFAGSCPAQTQDPGKGSTAETKKSPGETGSGDEKPDASKKPAGKTSSSSEASERRKKELQATIERQKARRAQMKAGSAKNKATARQQELDEMKIRAARDVEMARIQANSQAEAGRQQMIFNAQQLEMARVNALNQLIASGAVDRTEAFAAVGTISITFVVVGSDWSGVTLTANDGIAYQLNLNNRGDLNANARKLNGRTAVVSGTLRTTGSGAALRRLVTVQSLDAPAVAPTRGPDPGKTPSTSPPNGRDTKPDAPRREPGEHAREKKADRTHKDADPAPKP